MTRAKQYTAKELREVADNMVGATAVAIAAIRFTADLYELAEDGVSVEAIGIRVKNQLGHL